MRDLKDLSELEKKEIYYSIIRFFDKKDFTKTLEFIQSLENIHEKLTWLINYKTIIERNSLRLDDLEFIKYEIGSEESLVSVEYMINKLSKSIEGEDHSTLKDSLEIYNPVLLDISKSYDIINNMPNSIPFAVENPNVGEIKRGVDAKEESRLTIYPVLDVGIAANEVEEYWEEVRLRVDVLIELFPRRDLIAAYMPVDVTVTAKPGRKNTYVLEERVVKKICLENKKKLLSQIKDQEGNIVIDRVVRSLKELLGDLLNNVSPRTIKRWVKETGII